MHVHNIIMHVAVTGRKCTLFLLLFDHFFLVYMSVFLLYKNFLESSNFVISSPNQSARSVPTLGFNCPRTAVGELSQLKKRKIFYLRLPHM